MVGFSLIMFAVLIRFSWTWNTGNRSCIYGQSPTQSNSESAIGTHWLKWVLGLTPLYCYLRGERAMLANHSCWNQQIPQMNRTVFNKKSRKKHHHICCLYSGLSIISEPKQKREFPTILLLSKQISDKEGWGLTDRLSWTTSELLGIPSKREKII